MNVARSSQQLTPNRCSSAASSWARRTHCSAAAHRTSWLWTPYCWSENKKKQKNNVLFTLYILIILHFIIIALCIKYCFYHFMCVTLWYTFQKHSTWLSYIEPVVKVKVQPCILFYTKRFFIHTRFCCSLELKIGINPHLKNSPRQMLDVLLIESHLRDISMSSWFRTLLKLLFYSNTLSNGVLQGSILGSVLLSIYINSFIINNKLYRPSLCWWYSPVLLFWHCTFSQWNPPLRFRQTADTWYFQEPEISQKMASLLPLPQHTVLNGS